MRGFLKLETPVIQKITGVSILCHTVIHTLIICYILRFLSSSSLELLTPAKQKSNIFIQIRQLIFKRIIPESFLNINIQIL